MDHLEPMSLRLIALELGADADKWTQLSGSLIIHREFGVGQLLSTIARHQAVARKAIIPNCH
jgi:hypothetical protein